MPSVYILYSASTDKYYVGFTTEAVSTRIERHNNDYYTDKYTQSGKPWELYLEITCDSYKQARAIEKHIKAMKSGKYIENLKAYAEMQHKLLDRFADS
jgi:putative endonuclease